jgi:hypothetical protein
MGVLGITYDKMRAKAVKLIGERNVAIIEKLVGYIRTLVTGGPAALWEQVKGDLANLKSMVIDAIQSWLIETVVKQAVMKIVSMFNPAGAIVQAILAIYNIVMFVVEKAAQIMAFVESVINSVHAIATGAIGGAVKWIERALANTIPIVIGFLARLIGLGGISKKIHEFIMKVQSKVDQAIDKVIKAIVDKVKKLFGKGGKDAKDARTEAQKQRDLAAGTAEAHALLANPELTADQVTAKLPAIKTKYKLTSLKVVVQPKGPEEGETDYVEGEVNPRIVKPKVPKKPKTYMGAKKKGAGFEGSFSDPKWKWSGYPGSVKDHPANLYYGTNSGTKAPKPTGAYTVAGATTGGNVHTDPWRAIIRAKVDQAKAQLKLHNPGLQADTYERNAKKEVEKQYGGIKYTDLYLIGWDEHHVHPINWGGTNSNGNLKYLTRAQHSQFTTWFNSRKALILSKL